jgi:hypothetical protein
MHEVPDAYHSHHSIDTVEKTTESNQIYATHASFTLKYRIAASYCESTVKYQPLPGSDRETSIKTTAFDRQEVRKHVTVREPSQGNVRTQRWK